MQLNKEELKLLRDLVRKEGIQTSQILEKVLNRLSKNEQEELREHINYVEDRINFLEQLDCKLWKMEQEKGQN